MTPSRTGLTCEQFTARFAAELQRLADELGIDEDLAVYAADIAPDYYGARARELGPEACAALEINDALLLPGEAPMKRTTGNPYDARRRTGRAWARGFRAGLGGRECYDDESAPDVETAYKIGYAQGTADRARYGHDRAELAKLLAKPGA